MLNSHRSGTHTARQLGGALMGVAVVCGVVVMSSQSPQQEVNLDGVVPPSAPVESSPPRALLVRDDAALSAREREALRRDIADVNRELRAQSTRLTPPATPAP